MTLWRESLLSGAAPRCFWFDRGDWEDSHEEV